MTSVPDRGAGPCWVTVSTDGKYLYASNTVTDSIGVFSLADPVHPLKVQEFKLAGPFALAGESDRQTANFQIALDPSGNCLYVVTPAAARLQGVAVVSKGQRDQEDGENDDDGRLDGTDDLDASSLVTPRSPFSSTTIGGRDISLSDLIDSADGHTPSN